MKKVKVYKGRGIVKLSLAEHIKGKRALIVTGKTSANLSGALDDVLAVLKSVGAAHFIYDEVRENPSVQSAIEAGRLARENGCDFVIGIGGGSALDASKAAAAFAADEKLNGDTIFTNEIKSALPIIAIPTTAGTGSEANRFSVLTLDGGLKKKTYKDEKAYPTVSFLDPVYTESMSDKGTVSCALDALSHCIESYLSPKSTEETRELAKNGARGILSVIMEKDSGFDGADRETLLYSASVGGKVIDVTGTGFTHPLGYSVTLSNGVPHGTACGIFFADYVMYNYKTDEGKRLLDEFFAFVGFRTEDVIARVTELSKTDVKLSNCEVEEYIDRISGAANFKNSPYELTRAEMSIIYREKFSRSKE